MHQTRCTVLLMSTLSVFVSVFPHTYLRVNTVCVHVCVSVCLCTVSSLCVWVGAYSCVYKCPLRPNTAKLPLETGQCSKQSTEKTTVSICGSVHRATANRCCSEQKISAYIIAKVQCNKRCVNYDLQSVIMKCHSQNTCIKMNTFHELSKEKRSCNSNKMTDTYIDENHKCQKIMSA